MYQVVAVQQNELLIIYLFSFHNLVLCLLERASLNSRQLEPILLVRVLVIILLWYALSYSLDRPTQTSTYTLNHTTIRPTY